MSGSLSSCATWPRRGTKFTSFTGTKVQILAQKELKCGRPRQLMLTYADVCFTGTKVQILTQKALQCGRPRGLGARGRVSCQGRACAKCADAEFALYETPVDCGAQGRRKAAASGSARRACAQRRRACQGPCCCFFVVSIRQHTPLCAHVTCQQSSLLHSPCYFHFLFFLKGKKLNLTMTMRILFLSVVKCEDVC
jgi:hypothetical protein